jgi:hypothetical protein
MEITVNSASLVHFTQGASSHPAPRLLPSATPFSNLFALTLPHLFLTEALPGIPVRERLLLQPPDDSAAWRQKPFCQSTDQFEHRGSLHRALSFADTLKSLHLFYRK